MKGSKLFRTLAIVLAFVLLLTGCAEPLTEDQKAYAGLWTNQSTRLLITADGRAEYEKSVGGSKTSISGPVQHLGPRRMDVGIWFFSAEFILEGPPVARNGRRVLVVDGVELFETNRNPSGETVQTRQVPDLNELRVLVRSELETLADAIERRDFEDYIQRSSMMIQSQFTNEDMLENWAPLMERDIDIRDYMVGDFKLSDEPSIDEQGVLHVAGRYSEGAAFLDFALKYVYSAPEWRILGSSVNLVRKPPPEGVQEQ